MHQYSYEGPVYEFERCIAERWSGSTYAVSEEKARCNLAYQFKKQYNYSPRTKISLPGRIILQGRKGESSNGYRVQTKFS